MQCCRCLVQAGNRAASAQLDDLIGYIPQLKSLQQVNVGRVPVLLKRKHNLFRVSKLGSSFLHYRLNGCFTGSDDIDALKVFFELV